MKEIIDLLLFLFIIHLTLIGLSAQTEQKAELVVQTGITRQILSVEISPDGKLLAVEDEGSIKMWDMETGKELKTLYEDNKSITAFRFLPYGRTIVFANSDGLIQILDLISGQKLKTFQSKKQYVSYLKVSPNGKLMTISYEDEKIVEIWDVDSGKVRTLTNNLKGPISMSFSPDSKTLATGSFDGIKLWDIKSGKEKITLQDEVSSTYKNCNCRDYVLTTAFSPDGKMLASVNGDEEIQLWDVESYRHIDTLKGHKDSVYEVAFSPDGKTFASISWDNTTKLWNPISRKETQTLPEGGNVIAFSPDSKTLVTSWANAATLWDVNSARKLNSLTFKIEEIQSVYWSPNGEYILIVNPKSARIWNLTSGKNITVFTQNQHSIYSSEISPDGKSIAIGYSEKTIEIWDAASERLLKILRGHSDSVNALAFTPDSKILVSKSMDGIIKLWDLESGIEIKSILTEKKSSFSRTIGGDSLVFSIDGLSVQNNASKTSPYFTHDPSNKFKLEAEKVALNLYDSKNAKLKARLFVFKNSDWIVATPEGLFDSSFRVRNFIHYVIGLERISLEQMKDLYYVPGLLKKIIKGEPLPQVELFSKKDLFPDVEFSPLKAGQKEVRVKLTNRGGGIGQVQILVNGKEFIKDARPERFFSNAKKINLNVDLKNAPLIKGAENKIEVIVRNASGSLTNRGTPRGSEIINLTGENNQKETPNIYVIAGGISNYTGDNLKLNFAAKDAEDFAKAIELGASKLLDDKSKVHIRLLTSNGANSNVKFNVPDAKISSATKKDFETAFADFKTATPNDVFIVYLAGHGVSLNLNQNPNQAGGDTYLYLTQEATTTDKSVLSIENSRKAMAISSEELKDLMKTNKALKQVLVLDTCAAGALSNSLIAKRDLPSDQIRAIERLKDNTGFYVLMGSSADAVSYEASQYGQGLLTYSLLQAMKGAKLRENQFADVGLLFGYAQDTVPTMAKNIGGIQRPLIITPDNSNPFDIGKFTTDEQKQINLSNPKPIILRPNLRNSALRFDNLKLSQMMSAELRQMSYAQNDDKQSHIVFVEADEMTDAILVSGDYTIEEDKLKISIILVKNNATVGNEITVTGNTNELKNIIKQLGQTLMQSIK